MDMLTMGEKAMIRCMFGEKAYQDGLLSSIGDYAKAFCELPEHESMEEAFIRSRGRYGRHAFLKDFDCPEWAYDLLVGITGRPEPKDDWYRETMSLEEYLEFE